MQETCFCGHVWDEHGHDPKYPGSTACAYGDCNCIAFEADTGENDDDTDDDAD